MDIPLYPVSSGNFRKLCETSFSNLTSQKLSSRWYILVKNTTVQATILRQYFNIMTQSTGEKSDLSTD